MIMPNQIFIFVFLPSWLPSISICDLLFVSPIILISFSEIRGGYLSCGTEYLA